MSYFDIYAAIQKPIIDNSKFGIPWAFENEKFDPPSLSPWAKLTVIPSQPSPIEIGAVLTDEIIGIAQIDLFYPSDKGRGAALKKADEIIAIYQRNKTFTYNNAQVRVSSSGLSRQSENNPWYHCIITVAWVDYRCYLNN